MDLSALLERVEKAGGRACANCGKTFGRDPRITDGQWDARRFCSRRCGAIAGNKAREVPLSDRLSLWAKHDPSTGCLNWHGPLDQHGYGKITVHNVAERAHRVAYREWVGEIPAGQQVCHRCDNRRCIEPTHLFLGTNADNTADRNTKGRQARGERAGRAKLTEDDVRAIRRSAEPHTALAERYGVGPTAIHNIRTRRSWAHVSG